MTDLGLRLVQSAAEHRPMPMADREPEVMYLDLDGDGVLDAVRITERRVLHDTRDGLGQVVQVVSELVSEIDDDGLGNSTHPPVRVETQARVGAL